MARYDRAAIEETEIDLAVFLEQVARGGGSVRFVSASGWDPVCYGCTLWSQPLSEFAVTSSHVVGTKLIAVPDSPFE
jgi:hypothetical protein